MIIVTGGAGFIGSAIVWRLNNIGNDNIIIVDELGTTDKWKNLVGLKFQEFIHKDDFISAVVDDTIDFPVEAIIHMGANSSTTEKDADHLFQIIISTHRSLQNIVSQKISDLFMHHRRQLMVMVRLDLMMMNQSSKLFVR